MTLLLCSFTEGRDAVESTSLPPDLAIGNQSGLSDYINDVHGLLEEEGKYYVEESAWRLHNGCKSNMSGEEDCSISNTLKPLPPPPPLLHLPSTSHCTWSFDEDSRVLLANFRPGDGTLHMCREDESFLLRMMERDDVTVISEGLVDGLNPELWNMTYIADRLKNVYFHKFRKFQRRVVDSNGPDSNNRGNIATVPTTLTEDRVPCLIKYDELDRCIAMKMSDYGRYLEMRHTALAKVGGDHKTPVSNVPNGDEKEAQTICRNFAFKDDSGEEQSIDVIDVVLYMIDLDLVKLLPELNENFAARFKFPGLLPGGTHCMMNAVCNCFFMIDKTDMLTLTAHLCFGQTSLCMFQSCLFDIIVLSLS